MKLIAPDYYRDFKCIAAACRHSCCIGWEIDIDPDMLAVYDRAEGPFGERLRAGIDRTGAQAHFILGKDERCPFLNDAGLCDLIIEMGEENLCQICADHPRFRNYIADRTEIGLGLCCEAAGKLILSRKEKTGLVCLEDDGVECETWEDEWEILEARDALIETLQDRSAAIDKRLDRMLSMCGASMDAASWETIRDELYSMERLDSAWESCIEKISDGGPCKALTGDVWDTAFEQLAVYFAYRHLAGALDDGDIAGRAGFVAASVRIVRRICERCAQEDTAFGIDGLVEIARMFSSEIEYSDENTDALIALFSRG